MFALSAILSDWCLHMPVSNKLAAKVFGPCDSSSANAADATALAAASLAIGVHLEDTHTCGDAVLVDKWVAIWRQLQIAEYHAAMRIVWRNESYTSPRYQDGKALYGTGGVSG